MLSDSLVPSNVSSVSQNVIFRSHGEILFLGHMVRGNEFKNKVGTQGLMKLFECDSEDTLRSKLTGKIHIF